MEQSSQAVLPVEDKRYTEARSRAYGAVAKAKEPILAGVEAAITIAETDPAAARDALWKLQGDWVTLEEVEGGIGGDPTRAIMRLGAAIHAARAELLSSRPQLRRMMPEFLELLDGRRSDWTR